MKNRGNRFLPLIIVLILAGFLGFLIQDFVREVIVTPFLYIFWYVTLFLKSLPEFLFWGIFILITLIIAIKSLPGPEDIIEQRRVGKRNQEGSVALWSRLIHHAEKGGYSKWQMAQLLSKLTWDILGDGERLSIQQIDKRLKAGDLDLPPEIKAYFRAGILPYYPVSRFQHFFQARREATPLDLDPEEVVRYLERKLNPLTQDEPEPK